MAELEIRSVPAFNDNYVHLVSDPANAFCAAVDPGSAPPVLAELKCRGWRLTHILCTHHHADHIGGVAELKRATGCAIVGAALDSHRIPGIEFAVREGDVVEIGGHAGQVFEVPGHTSGHIAYWFADASALFCGDTLFSLGCGRMFEGTAEQMWASLRKLRRLPDATRVYCGHEYTEANARFALTLEPGNPALENRAKDVSRLRRNGAATVPSRLGDEKAANPFLRCDVPEFQEAAGLAGIDPVAVFADIRRRKDEF